MMRKRVYASAGLAVAALILGLGAVIARHPSTSAAPQYGKVIVPDYSLQKPTQPARLTAAQVINIIRSGNWSPVLLAHTPTLEYGGRAADAQGVPASEAAGAASVNDVWKVTFSGLNIPRPGGIGGSTVQPPPVSTLVIWVDDKTGRVLSADGY